MIKVLFHEKRIFLTPKAEVFLAEQKIKSAFIVFKADKSKLLSLLDQLLISDLQEAIVEGDPQELLDLFNHIFQPIVAAGGMVFNTNQEILFIFRRGKWDLPKGKLDPGESIQACAAREVMEETGLEQVSIVKPLMVSYHIYIEHGIPIFKTTYWYEMTTEVHKLTPQREEGITQALWVSRHNVRHQLSKTYESVVDLFAHLA